MGYLLKSEGVLQSWGNNVSGQLGIGTSSPNVNTPTPITCPTLLSIDSQKEILTMVLFPNPSNGSFSIQSKNAIQTVTAFDILGKQIEVKKNNESYKINASNGIYSIKISDSEGNSQIKKIIIN